MGSQSAIRIRNPHPQSTSAIRNPHPQSATNASENNREKNFKTDYNSKVNVFCSFYE
jgi:hypothetical protein